MYGGSTTSILLNVPGETASVITCIDGYQMAQKGKAGPALAICAIGSFTAGTLAIFGMVFLAPPLGRGRARLRSPRVFFPDGLRVHRPEQRDGDIADQVPDDGRRRA